ncbi:hypothetical protein GQ600_9548 [Phytophthora cactorum]|nr:hypothetical protein GQ600_9548 [Phytophthora cactorum]
MVFGFDLTYSDLFCFRDSAWLNDDAMHGFAVFLARGTGEGGTATDANSGQDTTPNEGKADPNDESDDKPPTQVAGPATRAAATSTTPARVPKIKLNGKVRRAGRPHLNCAAMKAKAALALIEYNNGMKLRALLRDNDVCDLVSTLWMIMPGVREVGSFLTTFPIKQKGGERPIQWRVDGDYVPDRVQFRLPESVVDTALDKLKGGLAHDEEIELDSDGDRAGVSEVYVVSIEKVGKFTREQLKAMKTLWTLQEACRGTGEGGTATDANSGQDTTPNEGKADPNDESDDKPPTQVAGPATRAAATSTTPARVPKIKLNGKVRRAGRPHLNCAAMKAKAALALIEYNNGMKLRALLRDNDVCDLVSTLWMIMPGVREVGSFLTTFPIKQKGGERPIQWRVDGDYVPDRVQFRLPESVVDTALDKLKGGLAHDEEIELDSDGDRAGVSEVYVVSIEKVGKFTREQLKAMKTLWTLQEACREGGTATDANSGQDTTPNEGKADPNDESDDKPPTQVAGPATRAAATSTTPARVPKIKLNGKVRRAGRPHLNCAAMKAKAALALIEYNNGMKLRALLRDNDVCDLVSTLWMIMPGVREVGSFLTTFPIKQKGGERPIQWRVDGDYVPDRVQFRLPESVVDTALDKLKGGLAHDEEIELDSDGDRAGVSEVYVVSIEKVGKFTREQLKAMKTLWTLQEACRGTGEGGTATDANSGQDTTPNEGKADPNDESDDKPPTQVAGPATRAAATSTTPARVPKIKLNGKVRRAGRPHLNCAAMKAKAALALIEYNNGMKLRALLRDNDVCDLVSTLWMIMPGVREVGSFLTTFPIKQKGGERPIQWRVDGDYVPDRVQFRLPESVVDTALDKLKGGLAHDEEIELDSDGDRAGVSEVYVVSIEKVGKFTREQLKAMKTLWTLQEACRGTGEGGTATDANSGQDTTPNEGKADPNDESDDKPPTQVAGPATRAAATSTTPARVPKIKLNGKVRRAGRPHLNCAAMKAKAALALIEYNNGMKLRALLRDNDVCDLRPIQWRVDGDYVPDRVQFRLPESVVDTALDKLKGGLAHDEEIELDSDGDRAGVSEVYVVSIEKVGKFTREQLKAMKTLWTLQEACRGTGEGGTATDANSGQDTTPNEGKADPNDESDDKPPTQVAGPATRAAATSTTPARVPKIKLNGKVRRAGRPHLNCAAMKAKAALALIEYNNGMKLRALLRDNDVCDLVSTLWMIMPGVREVGSFLTTFPIKQKGGERPIQWRVDGDYVPDRVQFRLPESVVDTALDKLKGGLAHDEEIELDSDGDRAGVSEVYVVSIEKVGKFTREQLKAMKTLWTLQEACRGTGEGGTATDANSGQDTTPNEGKADPNDESDDKPPTQVAGPATRAAATSTTPARVPKIKLNGKVRRAGRPHLNCAAMKAKAALALIEYNNGMKLRALLRDNDVCDLVSTLWMIMPGVREVGSFLTTFPIKQKGGERPIQWRVDGDYVPDRVQFRLPESVVDTALDKLKGGLAHDEEIELDSDGDRAGVSEVYVVSIEKVGKFTREQLKAMKTLWTLQEACREGGTATDANSGQDTTPNEGKADPNDESDDKPPTQVAGPATRAAATSTTPARVPKIKLNGKVRRAGRPHLNCAAMKAKAALALIEYNNGMKLRALLRDNDVCDLVSTLWMIMPGVREVGSFLTTFPIKQKGGERPIQWRVDGDYVPDRVQFRLPESVVDTALDKLKGGLAHDEEIELDSDGDRAGVSEVYVVSIEKVGKFTREQLKAMKTLWTLQEACRGTATDANSGQDTTPNEGKADPNDESDDKPPTQVAGPATRAAATIEGRLAHDEEIELDSDGDRAGGTGEGGTATDANSGQDTTPNEGKADPNDESDDKHRLREADPNDESDDKPPTQVADLQLELQQRVQPSSSTEIKLNGKVRRAGRPHLNCAAMKAKAALALIEYNNGMKLRALLRDNDVCDLVSTLWMIMPGVREVGSFLTTFPIKQKGGRDQFSGALMEITYRIESNSDYLNRLLTLRWIS